MIFLEAQFLPVAVHCQHEVSHISWLCGSVNAGIDVSQRMDGKHIVRSVCAFMPGHHSGNIEIREMLVHLRKITRIIQTDGCIGGREIEFISAFIGEFHDFPAVEKNTRGFGKIAFLVKYVPYMKRDMAP